MTTTDPRQAPAPEPAERLAQLAALQGAMVGQLPHLRSARQALEAHEMRVHATLAQVAIDRAALTDGDVGMAIRSLAGEVGAAMQVSDRAVEHRMQDAADTMASWPAAHAAFAEGRISARHLRVLRIAGGPLCSSEISPEVRAAYEVAMLDVAQETTAGRFERIARREADRFLVEPRTKRHQTAREQRCVRVEDGDDGMSGITCWAPSVLVHAIHDRLTQGAKAKPKEDPRTVDQWRADAACELLLVGAVPPTRDAASAASREASDHGSRATASGAVVGLTPAPSAQHRLPHPDESGADYWHALDASVDAERAADSAAQTADAAPRAPQDTVGRNGHALTGIRPTIQITVPVLALLGHDDAGAPALLDGAAPIDIDTARRLAADAPTWERILTHPITGHALVVDTYTPSAAQRRWLRARDQHCRWPGCAAQARHAELDHTKEWRHGGTTSTSNLASLCTRHHIVKTVTAWRVQQRTPGVLEWTSPAGITYVDTPPRAGPTITPF